MNNWQQVLTELDQSGISQQEIAKFAGCSQPTISELARGLIREPKYSIGKRLIELHGQRVTRDAAA